MKIAAIITSYDGHLYCLEDVIRAARKAADIVICGYDVHETLPFPAIVKKCDYFFTVGRNDWDSIRVSRRKQLGEIAQIKAGILLASDSDYIIKIDGDVVIGNPAGVRLLIKRYIDKDLIFAKRKELYGTTVYLGSTRAIKSIYSRISGIGRTQVEKQFYIVIKKLLKQGLKCAEFSNEQLINDLDYHRVKN